MNKALHILQSNGFKIKTVYDIGANIGKWTRDMSRSLPSSNFIMFEANELHRTKLEKRNFPYFIEVLSKAEEEKKFFSIGGTGDSLYLENTVYYTKDDFKLVKTKTLDSIIETNNLAKPNFIKLDAQGAELDILEGAKNLWNNVF